MSREAGARLVPEPRLLAPDSAEAERREPENQIRLRIRREHQPRDQRGDDQRNQVTALRRAETIGARGGRK